jgi:hypothetical protein
VIDRRPCRELWTGKSPGLEAGARSNSDADVSPVAMISRRVPIAVSRRIVRGRISVRIGRCVAVRIRRSVSLAITRGVRVARRIAIVSGVRSSESAANHCAGSEGSYAPSPSTPTSPTRLGAGAVARAVAPMSVTTTSPGLKSFHSSPRLFCERLTVAEEANALTRRVRCWANSRITLWRYLKSICP